ncbi:MAG TPA: hypothetical protein VHH36_03485 [Candidatus Thermoplasmatota archaeon]|nr:hypothetical protein [Candidatus Thermoplasmatota archaeon]
MTARRSLAVVLTALLAAPSAAAVWRVQGNAEPDTPHDLVGPAWLDPDAEALTQKAYFNAVAMQAAGAPGVGGSVVNPNVLPGSRLSPGELRFTAYFGAWRDCNGDGYVGAGASALWAYRAELLPAGSPCAADAAYNRDGWVHEFRWISPLNPDGPRGPWTAAHAARQVTDMGARVWGDFGRPGEAQAETCRLHPPPRGTWATGANVLAWLDCAAEHQVARTWNGAAPEGLRFDDADHPERDCDHPLSRQVYPNPYRCGDDVAPMERRSGKPAFTVWDCSQEPVQRVRDPTAPEEGGRGQLNASLTGSMDSFNLTDPDGYVAEARVPAPRADHPTDGSYWEALFLALQGADSCDMQGISLLHGDVLYRTPPEDAATLAVPGKRTTDFTFQFSPDGYSTGAAGSAYWEYAKASPDALALYNATPFRGGVLPLMQMQGGGWTSSGTHGAPEHSSLVRSDGQPKGAAWFTFYARVATPREPVALPAGAGERYGHESCPAFGSGVAGANGWSCDPDAWWDVSLGDPPAPHRSARAGDAYSLRDVDCYDHAPAPGLPASLATFTEEGACPEA